MSKPHLYLFTLEVVPLRVDSIYDELPLHCTLMHRFWSDLSSEKLAQEVELVFQCTQPLGLVFGAMRLNGPQKARVNAIQLTDDLQNLHMQLYVLLNKLGVGYTAPQWVGKGFAPHVTEREGTKFAIGHKQITNAAYLIEVGTTEHAKQRIVRTKFELKGASARAEPFSATEYWPDTESKVCFIPSDELPNLPMTVAVVYAIQDDEILLIKNERGWDIPGGHIEPGETPEQAAVRELMEEAGATVEQMKLIGYLKVTKLKENERNKVYPAEGAIVVYKGSSLQLHEYKPQFEATERLLLPIDQLQDYHHNWSEMKRQVIDYVREL